MRASIKESRIRSCGNAWTIWESGWRAVRRRISPGISGPRWTNGVLSFARPALSRKPRNDPAVIYDADRKRELRHGHSSALDRRLANAVHQPAFGAAISSRLLSRQDHHLLHRLWGRWWLRSVRAHDQPAHDAAHSGKSH